MKSKQPRDFSIITGRGNDRLAFDATNGYLFSADSVWGSSDVYRCQTSTGCDDASEWVLAFATSNNSWSSIYVSDDTLFVGDSDNGYIYTCSLSSGCNEDTDFSLAYDSDSTDVYSFVYESTNDVMYAGGTSGNLYRREETFAATTKEYASIDVRAAETANGSEEGLMIFNTMQSGSVTEIMRLTDSLELSSNLKLNTGNNLIFDNDDSGDTYLTHDSTNDRLSFYVDNTEMFRVDTGGNESSGSIATSLSDLAEAYPTFDGTLEAGDLVMIDGNSEMANYNSLVKKADYTNRDKLVGIVSTSPGLILGGGSFSNELCQGVKEKGEEAVLDEYRNKIANISTQEDDMIIGANIEQKIAAKQEEIENCFIPQKVLVALSGRVPVKIELMDGEEINSGDPLTLSSTTGEAMKAQDSGMIIGHALEKYNATDQNKGQKTIMALLQISWWEPNKNAETKNELSPEVDLSKMENLEIDKNLRVFGQCIFNETSTLDKLTISGTLEIQPLALGNIEFESGKIVMTTEGNLKVIGKIEVGQIAGSQEMRGSVKFTTGMTEYRVEMNWEESPEIINLTPSWETNFWVTDLNEKGFIINISNSPNETKEVYWLAIW